jgi:hypothetical protein
MIRNLFRFFSLAVLALIGLVGLLFYNQQTRQSARITALEDENFSLRGVIDRLAAERRVAELIVTRQDVVEGKRRTTVMLVEHDRSGKPMSPRRFDLVGEQIHVDGKVIKFDTDAVRADDPLRGKAILLLDKIYGDATAPADAERIDTPGRIPSIYRDAQPDVSDFEQTLWNEFWSLHADESLRQSRGVRVAHGAGVFAPFQVGRRYEITLTPDGNLTLHAFDIPPIYRP